MTAEIPERGRTTGTSKVLGGLLSGALGVAEVGGPILGADMGAANDPAPLHMQAGSASVQASSPSAQVKGAPPQVGEHRWNWREKSCVRIQKYSYNQSTLHEKT